jgi:hypothetical protein
MPLSVGATVMLATTLPICLVYFAITTRSISYYPWSRVVLIVLGAFGLYLPSVVMGPSRPNAEGDSHRTKAPPPPPLSAHAFGPRTSGKGVQLGADLIAPKVTDSSVVSVAPSAPPSVPNVRTPLVHLAPTEIKLMLHSLFVPFVWCLTPTVDVGVAGR